MFDSKLPHTGNRSNSCEYEAYLTPVVADQGEVKQEQQEGANLKELQLTNNQLSISRLIIFSINCFVSKMSGKCETFLLQHPRAADVCSSQILL